jgi:Ca2+-binding RTX toxin-like protein
MPTSNQSISLNPVQLAKITVYANPNRPDYPGMYKFIADEMKAGSIPGASSDQIYWFEQAARINGGDASSPASVFIREATRQGLLANNQPATKSVIDQISNVIGFNVSRDILTGNAIPPFSKQLGADISAAIDFGNMTIGGWGGAFYYWNETWKTDSRTGVNLTVGQAILNDPIERAKFVNVTASAVQAVADSAIAGDFAISWGNLSAVKDATFRGLQNLADNGLPGKAIACEIVERVQARAKNGTGLFMKGFIDALSEFGGVLSPNRLISEIETLPTGGDVANAIAADLSSVLVAGETQPPNTELFTQVRQAVLNELVGLNLAGASVYGNVGGLYVVLLASGEQVRVNTAGQVASTRINQFDDGTSITTNKSFDGSVVTNTTNTSGANEIRSFDADGRFFRREVVTPSVDGSQLDVYNAAGVLQSTTSTTGSDSAGWTVRTFNADGSNLKVVKRPDGSESVTRIPSYTETFASALQDTTSLISAIKSRQPLPAVASGIRLLNTLDRTQAIPGLSQANTVAAGALSLYNLANAFGGGASDLTKVTATLNAVNYVNTTFAAAGATLSPTLNSVLNGGGASAGVLGNVGVLPVLGLILAIKAGDPIGAAMSIGTLIQGSAFLTTPLGWVLIAASLVKALEEPPEAWGVGTFKFGVGTDLVYDAQGESFGIDRVRTLMQGNGLPPKLPNGQPNPASFGGVQGYLQGIVDAAAQANPYDLLGIIPQRLPQLQWREARQEQPGYALVDIDPISGKQRFPDLRYGDDWNPYNADATDPAQTKNIFDRLVTSAIERGAVAPLWEVQTARLQQDAGDPLAGLIEEERAARRGVGAALNPITNKLLPGVFRPITLDLDGDGRITTVSNADTTRAFNWDGSGFDKQVGWVGNNDGLLFLDRNPNGVVDSGKELFSNSAVADAAKGVRSLAWVDANGDGLINSADPVFAQLKVWQDTNGNAQAEAGELQSMAQLGITELDYNNGRFSRNGQLASLQSTALETSADGQRVSVVPDGIKVEFDNGRVLVYPTRVADASLIPRVTSVSNGSAVEGAAVDFTVRLNVGGVIPTLINLALQNGTASQATDLTLPMQVSLDGGATFTALVGGAVTVPAGMLQIVVRVQTADDAIVESLETFTLKASAPANAAAVVGTGSIVDNDGVSQLSISGPATVSESAGTLTYTVNLSRATSSPVTVNYSTVVGSAAAGTDYLATSGALTFDPGQMSKTFTVALVNDALVEPGEAFSIALSDANGASIAVGSVQTTIQDDDTPLGDTFTAGDDDLGVFNEDGSVAPTTTPATLPVQWGLLLANDSFNGSATGLTITQASNGQHVQVTLDTANRTVLVTPNANYVGQASFEYTVQSADGQTRTATAFMTFSEVNDPPVVSFTAASRNVYGYGVLATSTVVYSSGDSSDTVITVQRDVGLVQYQPFNTVAGRLESYVSDGSDGTRVEYGPLEDTGIPESYYNLRAASIASQQGPDGSDGSVLIVVDGLNYRIFPNPPTYLHATPIATEQGNDGQITVSDVDGGTQFAFELVPGAGPLQGRIDSLDRNTGSFTYTGKRYVATDAEGKSVGANVFTDDHSRYEANGFDSFQVKVIDLSDPTERTYTLKTITVPHYGPPPIPDIQSGAKKPIAIDLNGDGFHFTDVDDSNVFFNVNSDGWRRRIAWNNPADGFIAFDKNGDGKITDFDEISFVPYKPDGQTDLEGLQAFDTNKDGKFSAADDKWASFGVWQDANSNGVSDPGEFRSMSDLGIQTISLTSDGQFQVINGQTVHGTAVAGKTDGTSYNIADVSLRYRNETQISTAGGGSTTVPVPTIQPGTVFNGTAGADLVLGTNGSDMFVLGDGNDVVNDDLGNDGVQAGAGDDLIYTGTDNDVIDAGVGNDTVFAGTGNDLVFGDDGDDFIMLEGGNDVAFGGAGQDFISGGEGNDAISGDAGDDKLFGEGGWDALFGKDGDDELWGMDGNDLLYGDAGNDLLVGGAGDDEMEGGAGNDIYEVDSLGDKVTELASEGTDTIRSSINYTLAANFENLSLTGTQALNGTGNAAANVLMGNDGNNVLLGLEGNDTLDGGQGADRLVGGTGDDSYVIDNIGDVVVELAGEGVDTVQSRITTTLGDNIENLTLIGINAIGGTGNQLDNQIVGNAGANRIDGGAGADQMRGGGGNDTYVVDNAGDQVVEALGAGYDTVESRIASYALGDNVEALVLGTGAVNGTGNALNNALTGNALANTLDGGAGADVLLGGAGNDTYIVDNVSDVVVEKAAEGSDSIRASVSYSLSANVENLTLTGAANIDATGNSEVNVLTGNAGDNRLDGGAGADVMAGGTGDDSYVVDNTADQVVENAGEGTDTILASVNFRLSANVENLVLTGTAISGTGNALGNTITGNAANNFLDGGTEADSMAGAAGDDTYVVDNAGDVVTENGNEGVDTVIASVSYALKANVENLILSGAANINAVGNGLANVLTGNTGNNNLDGGAGADTMAGGAGDDTYVVDSSGDRVVENASEGVDTVRSSVDWTLSDNVENLQLFGAALNGAGSVLANTLTGNALDNQLDGGAGADTLIGGAGNDTYIVDNVADQVIEAAGEGVDTVRASVSYVLAANLENMILTGTSALTGNGNELANTITGNAGDNLLSGLAGNDVLSGGAGNDMLDGGTGSDRMSGGVGDDTYVVDNAADQVLELANEGNDTVLSSVSLTLSANVENLTLTGGAALNGVGNELGNTLRGNAAANTLDGGVGADTMVGGAGDDFYIVDNVGDLVVENANEGIDTIQSSVSYALAGNVENLALTGTANINGIGNELANVLVGNAGNNLLDGGAGADALSGGMGDDSYIIDNAGDVVIELAAQGFDQVSASIDYALTANVEQLTLTGTALNATGNTLDNLLFGNAQANVLDGASGADRMAGGLGDDRYIVDNAGDLIVESAAAGTDTVLTSVSYGLAANVENLTLTGTASIDGTGNELTNTLVGNSGNNRLDGGTGADTMSGGAGDDSYVVDNAGDVVTEFASQGFDQVSASIDYALTANVEQLTLTGTALNATGNTLDNLLFGNAQANVLDGGAGADRMAGGLGDDRYIVDNVGDVVVENAGSGSDTVLASVSYALAANVENLTLTGTGNIDATGNELANTLVGNSGNNRLDGGAGADAMSGGSGDDSYVVDNAGDLVTEIASQGFDQVSASIDYALTANVEQLTLTGTAINATGNALDNLLFGNAQANVIDGGAGADRMEGGLGDDRYVVDNAGDTVVEGAAAGTDSVLASVSYGLSANVENLTLTGSGNIDATGNELANVLLGNSGNNRLDGGTGADTMSGGAGDDSYVVDNVGDLVTEVTAQGFDRVNSSISYVLTSNVEQLTLTGSALNATGNALDNLLFGNDQANVLDGAAGADQMSGGLGDDRYVVDNVADVVNESANAGNDTVVSSVSYSLATNVENLILSGNAAINGTGNADANVLVGSTGANTLTAGAGNDVLAGGLGNDMLDGGTGDDLYLYNQGEGRDVITDASGTDTLRFGAGITLDSVAARTVVINGQSKVFISVLTTDGTEQQDQGIELLSSGGVERFQFANGTVSTLADLLVSARALNGDSLSNTLTGDRRDDTINAGGGNDIVYGRSGNDIIDGSSGADQLFGEGGNDKLYGGTENDQLWGGAGDDYLDGSSGDDQLVGGTGNDLLYGGVNNDVLDGGAGADSLDGSSGEDQLFGGAGNDALDGGVDADLLAAGDGDDVINGGSGQNVVIAGIGNDAIVVGTDRDFIDAGAGDDTITTDSSSDFIAAGKGNDTINTGTDRDLMAFNRGDGADLVVGSGWDRDTLSVGGGIRYADISLRKSGNDIVVDFGQADSITFKDWYTSSARRSVDTLQVVTTGGDYSATSSDRMKNRKVVSFDFEQLANRFDAVRAASPSTTSWAVAGELNNYFKASSDTQAIGGDLAYRYATTGSYGDLDWMAVRNRMSGMTGAAWQTLNASTTVNPWTALQAGISLIADQTVGLPSPITPVAALSSDELAFAALNSSGGTKPSWAVNSGGRVLP